jgi:hypothetical protein
MLAFLFCLACCQYDGCTLVSARNKLCWSHYRTPSRSPTARRLRRLARINALANSLVQPEESSLLMMPGMDRARRTRLSNLRERVARQPECHPTDPAEVYILARFVHLSGLGYDACAGTCNLARTAELASTGTLVVHTADIDEESHEGLDSYGDSLNTSLPVNTYDFILFSPPFVLLDMFLVWALRQPVQAVIVQAAGDYWSNAPH